MEDNTKIVRILNSDKEWVYARTTGEAHCGAYSCAQVITAWAIITPQPVTYEDGVPVRAISVQPVSVAMFSGIAGDLFFPWGSTRILNSEEFFAKYSTVGPDGSC